MGVAVAVVVGVAVSVAVGSGGGVSVGAGVVVASGVCVASGVRSAVAVAVGVGESVAVAVAGGGRRRGQLARGQLLLDLLLHLRDDRRDRRGGAIGAEVLDRVELAQLLVEAAQELLRGLGLDA